MVYFGKDNNFLDSMYHTTIFLYKKEYSLGTKGVLF